MTLLPRASGARELLDGPVPLHELEANLSDLARLNRFFGGARLARTQLARLLDGAPADRPITILDVGTGGADLPIALVRWARRSGRRLRVLALDRSGAILSLARWRAARYPEITFLRGEALRLPLRASAVDVALASLTLHHLEPPEASTLLAELHRVTRLGFIINDLIRSRRSYFLVWLATRIFTSSRLSRHDGPLSVLRAYTPAEILELARQVGLTGIEILCYPWLSRLAAVGRKE